MTFKVPDRMYSKGPKNNPAPAKSWDTSGSHAYGDAQLRNLNSADTSNLDVSPQTLVSLTVLRKKK